MLAILYVYVGRSRMFLLAFPGRNLRQNQYLKSLLQSMKGLLQVNLWALYQLCTFHRLQNLRFCSCIHSYSQRQNIRLHYRHPSYHRNLSASNRSQQMQSYYLSRNLLLKYANQQMQKGKIPNGRLSETSRNHHNVQIVQASIYWQNRNSHVLSNLNEPPYCYLYHYTYPLFHK